MTRNGRRIWVVCKAWCQKHARHTRQVDVAIIVGSLLVAVSSIGSCVVAVYGRTPPVATASTTVRHRDKSMPFLAIEPATNPETRPQPDCELRSATSVIEDIDNPLVPLEIRMIRLLAQQANSMLEHRQTDDPQRREDLSEREAALARRVTNLIDAGARP